MDGKKKHGTAKEKIKKSKGKHKEAGRNSHESERQTSHQEILRKSQEVEVETQTSHPAIKRVSKEPQNIPKRKSQETRPVRRSQEIGKTLRKSQELAKPARKSQETGRQARKSQDVESKALKPQQQPTRASLEVKKQKSPPTETGKVGRSSQDLQKLPAGKSTTRVSHNPEFPDLEEEQAHLVPKKPPTKPSKNIFQKLAETVSSIFLGPKSSDDDSEDAARRNVQPILLKDAGSDMSRFFGPPVPILDTKDRKTLEVKSMDEGINRELSLIMEHYKETSGKDKKSKDRKPKYSYGEIMTTLRQQGIPLPSDEDFARLENSHGQRWDPDGTVLEYYSPVLRSFIPLNMRGRYRGCWTEDQCIQGLDISKLAPKPDALEGYVDRGRQYRIQAIFDALEPVALSEDHLDYLVEVYKTQVLLLPIPIFYDVLNLGCETLNWNIKILQSKEGIPPQNKIYSTTEERAVSMQKKLQVYAALGLEPLFSPRKGMGRIQPQWTKTRDELITSLIARQHELEHERTLLQQAENAPRKKAQNSSKESLMLPQEFTDRVSLASMVQGDARKHK